MSPLDCSPRRCLSGVTSAPSHKNLPQYPAPDAAADDGHGAGAGREDSRRVQSVLCTVAKGGEGITREIRSILQFAA